MVGNISPQYNHFLYVLDSDEGVYDEEGLLMGSASSWTFWAMCREETNGSGSYIYAAGKGNYQYSALIQMPVGTQYITDGTEVIVSNRELEAEEIDSRDKIADLIRKGVLRIAAASSKFDVGRLHCRMWL